MAAVLGELRLYVVGVLTLALAVMASGHAILYKRDSRAAVAWVGLIWLAPVMGAVLYAIFGINRIRRRASELRAGGPRLSGPSPAVVTAEDSLMGVLPPDLAHLVGIARAVDGVARRPLTAGNRVTPLVNGDEAYPAMLEAIAGAQRTVALASYIFDNDAQGRRFVDTLQGAVKRGVTVRVLVDGVGARYSWPTIVRPLRQRRVPVARFLPTFAPLRAPFMNLRNHRKLLIVDGRTGFTGGMNIRAGHVLGDRPRSPVQDLHARLDGPVVRHLMEAFVEDWAFTTREILEGEEWFPPLDPAGPVAARGLTDGPDEDFEKLRWTLLGALATAQHTVHVVTPYFIPDPTLIAALNVAAMRGVEVDIILPERGNLPPVQWASDAILWQLVTRRCRVFRSPSPFDHTKLMVLDGAWVLIGSSNWDPRSLRLNFEFDVECYDPSLGGAMDRLFDEKRQAARLVTYEMLQRVPLPLKLRNGVARLFSPYL